MAAALVLLILSGLVVQGQQTPAAPPAPPPSGAISGVVVDGAGGQPLSDIIVQIAGGQLPQDYRTRQVTDSRGRFAFVNLPDGSSYRITAFKFGHLDGGYGRDTGPSDALRNISIVNGAWVPNLKVPIWRPSTLAALSDLDALDLLDMSFLEQIAPAGVKVSIGETEKRVQDLRIR